MCIAITSPKNNPMPTDEILKICFRNNSDGAGFAFNTDNNQVKIVKGFMDFESFITALHEYDEKYNFFTRGLVIHCRIGTSGKTTKGGYCDQSCTHPFPISSKDKHLKKLNITSNYAVVHNGIINHCTDKNSDLSDTMIFIKKYLSKLSTNKNWFYNKNNIELIYDLIDSKMAILNGNGDIAYTPGYHQFLDGNYYSNYSYMKSSYGLYGYGFLDDWYADYYYGDEVEMPLMELKRNEKIIYQDGTVEEYTSGYHDLFKTYMSDQSEIYTLYEEDVIGNRIPFEKLSFMGNGEIVDNFFYTAGDKLKPIDFRQDAVAIL